MSTTRTTGLSSIMRNDEKSNLEALNDDMALLCHDDSTMGNVEYFAATAHDDTALFQNLVNRDFTK